MEWFIKLVIKKILHKTGYQLNKLGVSAKYSLCPPYGYYTYSPWFEDWFQQLYSKIEKHTVVKEDRSYMLHRFAQHCAHIDGDFAECGVYKGGTAYLIATTINNKNQRKFHLFDTFGGMPELADSDLSTHYKGDFGDINISEIQTYLKDFNFITYHPGIIPKTFLTKSESKFAFVHIDVDLYKTTLDCCEYFYKRMNSGGIIIVDDYGFPNYEFTSKKAIDEFFQDKPETPITLRTGQCLIIKL